MTTDIVSAAKDGFTSPDSPTQASGNDSFWDTMFSSAGWVVAVGLGGTAAVLGISAAASRLNILGMGSETAQNLENQISGNLGL